TATLVPAARFLRPGLATFFAHPNRGVGGAPIRRPYILMSPQAAPDYFKCLAFFSCAFLRLHLPSSEYIWNRDRDQGKSCAPGTSCPPPSYEAFVVRAATPMAATSTCRLPTAAKAGSSSISVMAANAIWAWAVLARSRSHWRES